ncbi:hypothetical protein pipiens_011201 [Culex pipiens pipiens]|uniref:Uncharacterized protein n=1 Tax=Culex pipiens pipiens TaxID=38569 RepID=A0ABD1D791_CULPP
MKARQSSNQPKFVANLISFSSQFFIALFVATLAVAAQGSSYADPVWSVGLNSWSNHGLAAYPYGPVNQWAPVTYGGRKTQVEPIVVKSNPWELPAAAAYGYGYNHLGAIPAGKFVAPISGFVHQAPLVGYGVNQKDLITFSNRGLLNVVRLVVLFLGSRSVG